MENNFPEKFLDVDAVLRQKGRKFYPYIPAFFIRYLERITHQEELNQILYKLRGVKNQEFLEDVLFQMFGVEIEIRGLENVPAAGGCIVSSNHPLGGLDGMALMYAVGRIRTDIKFLANDILLHLPNLKEMFVAVNKVGANNKEAIAGMNQVFGSQQAVLIFPAGLVSRKQKEGIADLEWKKTFITKAIQHKLPVIPTHINGKNSNFFYNLARIRKLLNIKANIEMLYLADEMFKQKEKKLTITFGRPIPYTTFTNALSAAQWAAKVRNHVYTLPLGNTEF